VEEEDGVRSVFTFSQFRVCCKDRYYSSTSEHLFSHDKWQNGIRAGRIEEERKQTLEEKSCLLITLSPVLINPSTGERNPNWKSNFNQDICVFCILFSRAERAKVRATSKEAIRKKKKDRKKSFKLKYSRVLFNFAAPYSVPFHLRVFWWKISH
jgi:hypothetical protein